jgi:molybdopterin-guanine dinucleotide biosynthesis protein A
VYSALILAGGAGRRLGGPGKPVLPVGGAPMLERVLAAVADASDRIVVGPQTLALPAGVLCTSEQPAGGGPVAALAAGLPLVRTGQVALLAADLPFLTGEAVARLRTAVEESIVDGVVFVDRTGRRQTLCGVWRTGPLRARVTRLAAERHAATGGLGWGAGPGGPGALTGMSMRELLAGLRVGEVSHRAAGPPPWYDCDTQADWERAERWIHDGTG